MRPIRLLPALLLVFCLAPLAHALQLSEVPMISPITGKRFTATVVPTNQPTENDASLADMGFDDDNCRHSSGVSEYDYYVACDPYSYFAALTVEWDERTGRFTGELTPEVKDWVVKQFNSDWQIDHNTAYQLVERTATAQGQVPPSRDDFVMSQNAIPVHRKYDNALLCYEKRGARSVVLAKIALTAAWSLRVRFNVPVSSPQLAGGIEEINDRIARHIKEGEAFNLKKWTDVYRQIYEKKEVKTDEALLMAGLVYHGFLVRAGDHQAAEKVLQDLAKKYENTDKNGELLRGLVRERRESYRRYRTYLTLAATKFIAAVQEEEFSRPRLPEILLAVAESLRRTDALAEAAQWYLTLAQMPETQPKLRADIRAEGKAPSVDAPYHVQLGWIADLHLAELKEKGIEVGDVPKGQNGALLNAILFENFGTAEYKNPAWKPITGATQKECYKILDDLGKYVLEFKNKFGDWPATLDDLWMRDLIRDRNLYNRFYDPVSGKPYLYERQAGELAMRTVVIATPEPVPTPQGPRYGAYLAGNTVVWSETALKPGDVAASKQ